jgi:SRSO17 transposase
VNVEPPETLAIVESIVYKSNGFAIDGLTFPLMFEISKPKERLKLKDSYRSQPQIASQIIREIKAMGFEID